MTFINARVDDAQSHGEYLCLSAFTRGCLSAPPPAMLRSPTLYCHGSTVPYQLAAANTGRARFYMAQAHNTVATPSRICA
jgi:hypothetical protein